jgi:hypothetical protein
MLVWFKLELYCSPGPPPFYIVLCNTNQYFSNIYCDCSFWIPLFPIVLVHILKSATFDALPYVLMAYCYYQGLTGTEITLILLLLLLSPPPPPPTLLLPLLLLLLLLLLRLLLLLLVILLLLLVLIIITVKPVLNGTLRDQKIFPLKPVSV